MPSPNVFRVARYNHTVGTLWGSVGGVNVGVTGDFYGHLFEFEGKGRGKTKNGSRLGYIEGRCI